MRRHYLDNLRWATVLLVLVYHVFYMFNGVGVLGSIPGAKNIPFFDGMAAMIYPWFMVLLFVISGMSAKYALDKKSHKEFIKERAKKLIVPSTLGLFVIHWWTGYLNIKMGGGLDYMPKALVYPISVASGGGPLWFIQMLFVFSCLLVLIRKIEKDKFWNKCKNANIAIVFLQFIAIFLSAQVLNMPIITVYRFGIYFVAFLIGYFLFSHNEVQGKIESARWWSLGLTVVFGVWYGILFAGTNFTSDECLKNIITNSYLWFGVLTVLGFGKRYLNKPYSYMPRASFGIYILHYPVLITVGYVLTTYFNLPVSLNYAIALVFEIVITFVLFELIKRIPFARFLVLGTKKNNGKI